MLSYIKKYPISLFIILTVIYLSFFKPPKTDLNEIPNLDKLVHICMYFGMSGMLWLEFLRAHRRDGRGPHPRGGAAGADLRVGRNRPVAALPRPGAVAGPLPGETGCTAPVTG